MINIEKLVIDFKSSGSDEVFNEIHVNLTQIITGSKNGKSYFRQVAKSLKVDPHTVAAMFDDTLLSSIKHFEPGKEFINYFKSSLRRNRAKLFRDKKRKLNHEVEWKYDEGSEEGKGYEYELAADFNLEEKVITDLTAKKKADQRQLISFLSAGENERTTAIVQAFLTTEFKTPTAIGKYLGLDHKQVSRAIKRLAGKFDSKQFGEVSDYLVAL